MPAEGAAILVPLDGSPEAERALPFAETLVDPHGEIILLRVARSLDAFGEPWPGRQLSEDDLRAIAEEAARRSLLTVAERLRHTVPRVRIEVVFGDPADEIIRVAEAEDVEMIVMTTHGHGAAGRIIFGSVADRVARYGTRPTLLVRANVPPVLPDRLVAALDGSALAEQALPVAVRLAKRRGWPVHLVRVVDLDEIVREIWQDRQGDLYRLPRDEAYEEARKRCEAQAAAYLAVHAERLRQEGVQADYEVATGTPAFVLLELVKPGDLVVMTSHGYGGLRRWLIGSVTEKLVREAPSPVLIVRARAEPVAEQRRAP
jgi:nucleotide-binding universal stress UspA family protein